MIFYTYSPSPITKQLEIFGLKLYLFGAFSVGLENTNLDSAGPVRVDIPPTAPSKFLVVQTSFSSFHMGLVK
jgi:hypothetical protein